MREVLKNFLLVCGSLIVALLLLELGLRLFLPQSLNNVRADEYLLYSYVPDKMACSSRSADLDFCNRINAKGLNDIEHSYNRSRPRILVIGDSFIGGIIGKEDEQFIDFLQQRLPDYEVICMGVGSYSTDNQLIWLQTEGYKYHPDVVLLAMSMNDIWDNTVKDLFIVDASGQLQHNVPLRISPVKRVAMACAARLQVCALAYNTLLQSPLIIRILHQVGVSNIAADSDAPKFIMQSVPAALFVGSNSQVDAAWNRTYMLLDAFASYTRLIGAKPVVMMVPLREQLFPADDNRSLALAGEQGADMARPEELLASHLGDVGVPFIDLLSVFQQHRDEGMYYPVDGHWAVDGTRTAGGYVADTLRGAGLV
ncbi:hypothetical protein COY28_04650 [Candidatus Woesearchaeota archaeon CG_4_10_14_0_2_um_filter_57_5]|nr:MAG: hypothetical protein COY28_04650 [Candidatus Woesearchaeota archaeon CG_4_10_14_0_2_um_filter_57_5]